MKKFYKIMGLCLSFLVLCIPFLSSCSTKSQTYSELKDKTEESSKKPSNNLLSITFDNEIEILCPDNNMLTETNSGVFAPKDTLIKPTLSQSFKTECNILENGNFIHANSGKYIKGFNVNKKFYTFAYFENNNVKITSNTSITIAYEYVKPVCVAIYQTTPSNTFDENNFQLNKVLKYENNTFKVSNNDLFLKFVNLETNSNANVTHKIKTSSTVLKIALEVAVETTTVHPYLVFQNQSNTLLYLKLNSINANKTTQFSLKTNAFNSIETINLSFSTDLSTSETW